MLTESASAKRPRRRDPEATVIGAAKDLTVSSDRSLPIFYNTISTCLAAGFQIQQALDVAAEHTEDEALKECAHTIYQSLLTGSPMHAAFSQFPRIFDDVQRELIRLGQQGHLTTIFKRLVDITETRRLYRQRVQQTLIAPGFALVICLLINLLAPRFILPPLQDMLENLNLTAPLFSRIVFGAATFLTSVWFFIPVLLLGIWMYRRNSSERYDAKMKKAKAWLFRLPFVSKLVRHHTYAEWSKLLALQIDTGCLAHQAVGNLRKASIDPNFEQVTRKLQHFISRPADDAEHVIAEAMAKTEYFEPTMVEFVRVGEESGKLPLMLDSASRLYTESFQSTLDKFEALLSPTLTVLTGLVIGSWVVAFILPLAQIIGQL